MSICEIIFSTRKYPDLKDMIKETYQTLDDYESKSKAIKDMFKEDEKTIRPLLVDLSNMLTNLEAEDSNFKDYFLASKGHVKKKQKALEAVSKDVLESNKDKIEELKKLEITLTGYGITIPKFYKALCTAKDMKKELLAKRSLLETKITNTKDILRSLYTI